MKGGFVMRNEKKGKTAIAALIMNRNGEVFIVDRKDELTIPTGNMKDIDNLDPTRTLQRETKEELPGIRALEVVDVLDSFVRNKSSPGKKAKFIWVFSCFLQKGEIRDFKEGKISFWIRRTQALELPNLDELACQAIKDDLQRRPEPNKRGGLSDGKKVPERGSNRGSNKAIKISSPKEQVSIC